MILMLDPYCKELVDAGMLVDVKKFLEENDKYDDFYPIALKYQEFTDGSMYTLPLEYHVEMTWYNKEIFEQYNLTPPTTMDEWLNVCKTLKRKRDHSDFCRRRGQMAGAEISCNASVQRGRQ